MNFGGIHFFYGLFFLVCCMGMTIAYLYGGYLILIACIKGIYKFRYFNAQNRWIAGRGASPEELPKPGLPYLNFSYFKKSAAIAIILLLSLYVNQRMTWMKNANAHYSAKEYWVAGQVVFTHRKLMEQVLHPENILMQPYTFLQMVIYNRGVAYLPQNDGECHVWENAWFLHLYTRKSLRPYWVRSEKYEPDMVALLDRCWTTISGMANHPIEDPDMLRKSLLEFPLLSSYYTILQGHYTGKYLCSGTKLRQTPRLLHRLELILKWLDELHATWKARGMMEELKTPRYSIILTDYQETVIWILQELSLALAGRGEFDCAHPTIQRLYSEFMDVMSDDPDRNFFLLYSKKNLKQAKIGYRSTVYGAKGGAANYMLSGLCGQKMPEEKYSVVGRRDSFIFFFQRDSVLHIFKDELQNLKGEKK